jgi:hypothetical protein
MIAALLLILLQTAVEPMPPDHHVFDNEEAGGRAFEAAMYCLVKEGPKSKEDLRRAEIRITRAHSKCSVQTEKLREELVKIFIAYPSRRPNGLSPNEAADQFVANLLARFDYFYNSNPQGPEK